ncbi:hypothetical protein HSBAA_29160 [Vreelandella sulfidaeris]|uniref:Uncharacterized protein n=1 Tax=Vreelandella sulfidaeris TaxID=115553 RepID=A0A455U624_9GAMM|nr:hypothetical protein HSBAA_29160 [Halomonas sulfidaeris]
MALIAIGLLIVIAHYLVKLAKTWMKGKYREKTVIALTVSLALAASLSAHAEPLVISSGVAGGTYHNVFGANLSKILHEQRVENNLVASRGSVENLDRLGAGEVDVGFTQADALAAWLNHNPGAAVETIGALGQECVYIATAVDGPIDDEDDLGKEGVKIAVGEQGTGSAETWDYLRTLESDYMKASTFYQGGIRTLAQVKTGQMDAFCG